MEDSNGEFKYSFDDGIKIELDESLYHEQSEKAKRVACDNRNSRAHLKNIEQYEKIMLIWISSVNSQLHIFFHSDLVYYF
jgi:hypothetical protein